MKDLKEMDFETLKNNFDNLCSEINEGTDAVALTLRSGRKVYIMPEQSYDNISRFVIQNTSVRFYIKNNSIETSDFRISMELFFCVIF